MNQPSSLALPENSKLAVTAIWLSGFGLSCIFGPMFGSPLASTLIGFAYVAGLTLVTKQHFYVWALEHIGGDSSVSTAMTDYYEQRAYVPVMTIGVSVVMLTAAFYFDSLGAFALAGCFAAHPVIWFTLKSAYSSQDIT